MADEKTEKKKDVEKGEAIKKVKLEAKPAELKTEKNVAKGAAKTGEEKIITINLRKSLVRKPHWKRAESSASILREILKKRTRVSTVAIGKELNEALWLRGIERPETKLRIRIIKEGDTAKAELMK